MMDRISASIMKDWRNVVSVSPWGSAALFPRENIEEMSRRLVSSNEDFERLFGPFTPFLASLGIYAPKYPFAARS